MFGSNKVVGSSQTKKRSPREKKKAIIKEYERRYGVSLTEEELDELLDEAFNSSSFSSDTKEKVKKGLKDKKKGKDKSKKPQKKEK